MENVLNTTEQASILQQLMELRPSEDRTFPSFFVIERLEDGNVRVMEWKAWKTSDATDVIETIFGFVDPCALPEHPGWPLRNFLALLQTQPKLPANQSVRILSFREHVPADVSAIESFQWKRSRVFEVKWDSTTTEPMKTVGWEVNARGKMGPRLMELGGILDPIRLAEQSVDLNLKLMLWRQLPSLKLDQLASTKCLLLGAGTLGCYTARSLLSWGFRHITLVDNSTVSHSNPVRQPLFEFADCGKPKAECAANALKRIFPLVHAEGVQLSIPMAGHALSNDQLMADAKKGLETLTELIESHDVVFLGTDSRESRWLPTVICAAKEKVVINAALGFDSYLVMRHGVGRSRLGCYFCNDVVSPRDSLKDRTLDQMCTVTRPGLAPIASATAVELLVAVLHAADGKYTSATSSEDTGAPLGVIPHQLRGFLNAFQTVTITGQAFDQCIACSPTVVDEYLRDAVELLTNACNKTSYLEELTGIHQLTALADELMTIDSEEDDEAFC